jgi:MYXO-CTERM domain-containing protein
VQGVACGSQHAAECGNAGQQNSYAELMTLFGPSNPDTAEPSVSITYPADGATFPTDSDFTITVDANDDQAIDQVTLFSNDNEQGSDASSPYGWDVSNIPAGTYELYVVATDTAGNQAQSVTVTITVGDDLPPSNDDGADGADGADGGADGPADGGPADGDADGGIDPTATDDGSLPPGYGLDGAGEAAGCVCTSSSDRGGSMFGVLVLAFLGAIRRRR